MFIRMSTIILLLLSFSGVMAAEDEAIMEFFRTDPKGVEIPQPDPLLVNAKARNYQSLNGMWNIKVDEPGTGWFAITQGRYTSELDKGRLTGMELIETAFDDRNQLKVPGDWNSQRTDLDRYRGKVLYHKVVSIDKIPGKVYYLHFGGANYKTDLFVNDKIVGRHEGGYTAFNFDITDYINKGKNTIIVRVDAFLDDTTVPTMRTSDFWKYGGITRDVGLISLPEEHIDQYHVYLNDREKGEIKAWVQLSPEADSGNVTLSIPEVGVSEEVKVDGNGQAEFTVTADLTLWSPKNPKLYDVTIRHESGDAVTDKIGFRTFETRGQELVLNGDPIKLYGISMHEETPLREGVANTEKDARVQFELVKELGANYVRLAHYPHNEYTVKLADEMGLILWSEIPIVSLIDWGNEDTKRVAKQQLVDNITRDMNRASIGMWSIANESFPQTKERLEFLGELASLARDLDDSDRPIVAALIPDLTNDMIAVSFNVIHQLSEDPDLSESDRERVQAMIEHGLPEGFDAGGEIRMVIDDELGEVVDIIGYNQYFGWYYGGNIADRLGVDPGAVRKAVFAVMPQIRFDNAYGKPMIISEFGAGAVAGSHSDRATIWSEEYQAKVYQAQLSMLKESSAVQGVSPWILKDFRSHLRELNGVQETYNRKGVISETGQKKLAFDVLKEFYHKEREL